MNLVKQPTPPNFKSGRVSLSHEEAASLSEGDTLTILRYNHNDVLFVKTITQAMIDSIVDKGEYCLMRYSGY